MSALLSKIGSLFSRKPTPQAAAPAAPDADLRQWTRRSVEKVRTLALTGRIRILPWLDNYTDETPEIRSHYRVMLREPTLLTGVRQNVLAVAHQDVQVQPEDDQDPDQRRAAKAALWALKKVKGGPSHLAQSVLTGGLIDGWSLSEVVYREKREKYGPCAGKVAFDRVKAKDTRFLQLITDPFKNVIGVRSTAFDVGREFSGPELDAFILYTHFGLFESPIGMSAFRSAYRAYWIKDTAWQLRSVFLERAATPAMLGTYSHIDQKAALDDALADLQSQTWLTVPSGCMATALDIAGRGEEAFRNAIADCDKEMLVGVTGAHLPTMEGQATDVHGNTQVQLGVSELIQWALAASLSEVVTRQMLVPWYAYNYGDMPPGEASWGAVNENALLVSAQLDKALSDLGLKLSRKERAAYYGRQEPEDPQDELKPPGPPGSPPGGGDGGGGDGGGGFPGGPPGMTFGEWDGAEEFDPDAPPGWYGAEEDWTQTFGPRGGSIWTSKTGRIVRQKENPGKSQGRAKKEPTAGAEKPAKAQKPTPDEIHADILAHRQDREKQTPEHITALAERMMGLTVDQIKDVQERLGVKAGSKEKKAERAQHVAEWALAGAAARGLMARLEPAAKALAQNPDADPYIKRDIGRVEKSLADLEAGRVPPERAGALHKHLVDLLGSIEQAAGTGFGGPKAKGKQRAAVAPIDPKLAGSLATQETRAKVQPHLERVLTQAKGQLKASGQLDRLVGEGKTLVARLSKPGVTNKEINRSLATFESSVERHGGK